MDNFEKDLMKDGCLEIDEEKAKVAYQNMPEINLGMGRPTNNDMDTPKADAGTENLINNDDA